jgi:hypothetical protein
MFLLTCRAERDGVDGALEGSSLPWSSLSLAFSLSGGNVAAMMTTAVSPQLVYIILQHGSVCYVPSSREQELNRSR